MNEPVKLICLYGPESTGKTTMAETLAKRYNTVFVPEVGREVILDNSTFTAADIIKTARLQLQRIREKMEEANRILFVDSDHLTTAIYSQHYLGEVPAEVYALANEIRYDCYFLFDIDVPWVNDGVRDLGGPALRRLMYATFRRELEGRKIPFVEVKGSWEEREEIIVREIEKRFGALR